MKLAKLNRDDLDYVAANMRQRDKDEIYATRWSEDAESLTESIMLGGEFGWVAGTDDGVPVAAFGAIPTWDGVWEVWMFATDRWDEVAIGSTKFIKRVVIPSLEKSGAHRLQCRSLDKHTKAHLWLEYLGFQMESKMVNFGSKGESFLMYCLIRQPRQALFDGTNGNG